MKRLSIKQLMILHVLLLGACAMGADKSCHNIYSHEFINAFSRYDKQKLRVEDFHIEVHGAENSETIVLIHGLDSAAGTFYNIIEQLSTQYKVILYDQRGHGRTADINSRFSSDEMAADLKMILDHLEVDKAHILGHSMGARTATRFVSDYPQRSMSLIIEDMEMFSRGFKKVNNQLIKKYTQKYELLKNEFKDKIFANREELKNALEPYWGEEAESLTYRRAKQNDDGSFSLMFRPWNSIAYGIQGNIEDFTLRLRDIKKPILVMQADKNRSAALTKKGVKHILENTQNSSYHYFEGAGHTIHRADQEQFMNVLGDFLKMNKDVSKVELGSELYDNSLKSLNMLPRGSALITSAGELEKTGIKNIIHAATGSMTKSGGNFEPTLKSIEDSIINSLKLAKNHGHKRIAIPFIGGAIFLGRIGVSAPELAETIIKSAVNNRNGLEISFVAFGENPTALFQEILKKNYPQISADQVNVVNGSITEFDLHKASAIVNAANMEVLFGGGLSGAIARATNRMQQIDDEALELIKSL